MRIDISWTAVFRVLVAVAVVWAWLRLWQWVLLFVAAAFLAVGLDPLVRWLDARRIRRFYGAPLVVFAVALLLVAFGYFGGASLVEQSRLLGDRIYEVREKIQQQVPAGLIEVLPQSTQSGSGSDGPVTRLGRALMNGALSIALVFVLTIYLLLDGLRTYEWLVAFFPRDRRARVRQTALDARNAVIGYLRGNIATSVIAAIVTYIVLVILKVPAALLLALLAAVLNFIPVVGLILSAIPAVLLALTVSATTGIGVGVFYLAYNAFENYYIAPKVYGRELRLSDLAVIGAFAVGAELGGVIGALIALPIAAMYPTVERIWLADRLGSEVVEDHQRIQSKEQH